MSLALTLACIWAVASALVAMLPMRFQWPLGFPLLVLAVPLLGFIGYSHGWVWTLVVLAAVISMYRNPLRYFTKRLLGQSSDPSDQERTS